VREGGRRRDRDTWFFKPRLNETSTPPPWFSRGLKNRALGRSVFRASRASLLVAVRKGPSPRPARGQSPVPPVSPVSTGAENPTLLVWWSSAPEGRQSLARGASRRGRRRQSHPPFLPFFQPREGRKNHGRMARRTHEAGGRFLRPSRGWEERGRKGGRAAPASRRLTPWAKVFRPSGAKMPIRRKSVGYSATGGRGSVAARAQPTVGQAFAEAGVHFV
jgi:hypothetical protein